MAKSRRTKNAVVPFNPLSTRPVVGNHTEVSIEAVAARAYQLYVERGCIHGHDVEDWIEAEKQIRSEYLQTNSTTGVASA
jgi:hypothetical protein